MRLPFRGPVIDRAGRDHAADIVAKLLSRKLNWNDAPAALGPYSGSDLGVSVIHRELRAVAEEAARGAIGTDADEDRELEAVLERALRFLRSDTPYRWHEKGPVQIVGAYMGFAALMWFGVAGLVIVLGPGHEVVIAATLFAFALMYVMALAMAVALLRRLWWRMSLRREGASREAWPFFSMDEYHAAGPAPAGEVEKAGESTW